MSNERTRQPAIYLFLNTGGHRDSWAETIKRLAEVEVDFQEPSIRCFWRNIRPSTLYFLTLDDNMAFSLIVSVFRAILGKRTIGLYLGISRNLGRKTFKSHLKQIMLTTLNASHVIELGCILPKGLDPKVDRYCVHNLADLNCVDLTIRGLIPKGIPSESSRQILASFGLQTPRRGTELLMRAYAKDAVLREMFNVEIYGKAAGVSESASQAFKDSGGKLVIGWLDEAEMLAKIEQSDVIWCLFAPEYDQPSGVLGHAFQLGRSVILRRGSLLERYAQALGVEHIACEFDAAAVAAGLKAHTPSKERHNPKEVAGYIQGWRDFLLGSRRSVYSR